MATPETYYYGQGKVFLAKRNAAGIALSQRWVGDVSQLQITVETDKITHEESYSGNSVTVRTINRKVRATVNATWHEFSDENLAVLVFGNVIKNAAGTVTGEVLPTADIKAGDRFLLQNPNVSDVVIGSLVEGTDYFVEPIFGAINFLTDQTTAPSVNYSYAAHSGSSVFAKVKSEDFYFRFEGINLAEDNAFVAVDLYKINFDPLQNLDLINNDTDVAGIDTTATALLDNLRPSDAQFGQLGKIVHINLTEA